MNRAARALLLVMVSRAGSALADEPQATPRLTMLEQAAETTRTPRASLERSAERPHATISRAPSTGSKALTLQQNSRGARTPQRMLLGGVLIGTAVALGAAGGSLFAANVREASAANHAAGLPEYLAQRDAARGFRVEAAVLTGIAAVALLAGAITLALPAPHPERTSLWLSASTNGVAIGGSF